MKALTKTFKITNGVATVWSDPEEPTSFYLTTERGKNRGVAKLEAVTLDDAFAEAQEILR